MTDTSDEKELYLGSFFFIDGLGLLPARKRIVAEELVELAVRLFHPSGQRSDQASRYHQQNPCRSIRGDCQHQVAASKREIRKRFDVGDTSWVGELFSIEARNGCNGRTTG